MRLSNHLLLISAFTFIAHGAMAEIEFADASALTVSCNTHGAVVSFKGYEGKVYLGKGGDAADSDGHTGYWTYWTSAGRDGKGYGFEVNFSEDANAPLVYGFALKDACGLLEK